MSIDDSKPERAGDPAAQQPGDSLVEKIRDIPRMSSAAMADGKAYRPPAPTVSRIGAFTQGCGGLLAIVLSLPMLLVALSFGYYLWGPGLVLAGGVVLAGSVLGVWRGYRVPVIASLIAVVGVLAVLYVWRYFVFATAALSPLGQITDLIFNLGLMVGIMALVVTLITHVIGLVRWKRLLLPPAQWPIAAWSAALIVAVALPLGVSFTTQHQREGDLKSERDDWLAEAATDDLIMGVNGGVALGYSFALNSDDTARADQNFDIRIAELDAALSTGASPVRVTASGDNLLEEQEPRIFLPQSEGNEEAEPDPEYSAARLAEQIDYEERYMARIAESGADLMISDSQYSPYLLLRHNDEDADALTWDEFTALHEDRIRYYASTYQPDVYVVVTEPASYETYSGLELPSNDEEENLDAWVAHTEQLIDAVRDELPDVLVGVTIGLDSDFDLNYYERVLDLDGLDFVSVDIFQQTAFDLVRDLIDERGHPADHGKAFWITETWYGFCMAPQRSMTLDSLWLETVVAFAARENLSAVLPSSFGCFLQSGGTLLLPDVDLAGRTEAWDTWSSLVQTWQMPAEPAGD